MTRIRLDANFTFELASIFGCKVGSHPMKYLGLPLCLGIPKTKLWDPVIERIDKKLTSWEGKYLSLEGRVTLIKYVLASMPIPYSCKEVRKKFKEISFGVI